MKQLDFKTTYLHNKHLAICNQMLNMVWKMYWEVWKFESGKIWNFEMENV